MVFFVLLSYYKYLALHFVNSVSVGLGRKLQFYRLKKIQKPSMSISLGNPSIIMFKSWNVLIHSGICIPKPSSNFGNFNHWKECFCISKSNLVWFFFLKSVLLLCDNQIGFCVFLHLHAYIGVIFQNQTRTCSIIY